ncbi:MAG: sigma-70 family RNA polymerase sigma factor [Bacilli bacterium]|nr:sigma-70 family RNA polymerase sigma factor [Bacilli bacterium]
MVIKTVDRFDVSKGFSFNTYARWWVRQSIIQAIYNCSRNIRIPVRLTLNIYKYKRARADLSKNLQHEPSYVEIAKELNISEEYAKVLHEHQFDTISINSKIDDESTELGDTIISNEESLEESLMNKMQLEFIKKMFNVLTEREVMILNLRFGLDDGVAITLRETGSILNITRERVRQIEAKALQKLKIEFARRKCQQKISEQVNEQQRKIRIDNNISMDSSRFANFQKIYNQIDSGRLTKK